MTRYGGIVDELLYLANLYIGSDPVGGATIRRAAKMLAGINKVPCAECQRKYSAGYQAGYKKGADEWKEGLASDETDHEQIDGGQGPVQNSLG